MNWLMIISYAVFLSFSAYAMFTIKKVKVYILVIIFASYIVSTYSLLNFKF